MKKIIITLAYFMFIIVSYGQQYQVVGKVSSFGGISLQNIEVEASNSKAIVLTDAVGFFKIDCNKKDMLKVKADQFDSKRIRLKGKTEDTIIIELKFDYFDFDLNSVIENGHLKESDIPAAKAYLEGMAPNYCEFSNMYELMEVCCPGVMVDYDSSPPLVHLSRSNGNVVYVVNGIQHNMIDVLSPCDVKSIKVLKDATAAASYGTSGGVISIVTK